MSAAVARDQLRALVERIEKLEVLKAELASDIKDIYAEAKSQGFDPKTLRAVVSLRKLDPAARQEAFALLDLYATALDLQLKLPFIERAAV